MAAAAREAWAGVRTGLELSPRLKKGGLGGSGGACGPVVRLQAALYCMTLKTAPCESCSTAMRPTVGTSMGSTST